MNVMIRGSCVSRDVLSFDKEKVIDLKSFSSRPSFATLTKENTSKSLSKKYYENVKTLQSSY